MTIFLARHGQTDSNVEPIRIMGSIDPPLNETGREQAEELAERVVEDAPGLKALYCSHKKRAHQTAEVVGRRIGLEPKVDERFAESDRGRLEGELWEEVERNEPNVYAAWRAAGEQFRFPEGESLLEQQQRVLAGLKDIRQGPLPALVVCHGGSIRVALCAGSPQGLDAFHDWDVPNVALTKL